METSILTSVKKVLGIDAAYTAFDEDVIMHINAAFATLLQLGIGPENGFMIYDAVPEWDDFIAPSADQNASKTYVYLKVRLLFDPPGTSFLLDAIRRQIEELEWRLNVSREYGLDGQMPTDSGETILDGGPVEGW